MTPSRLSSLSFPRLSYFHTILDKSAIKISFIVKEVHNICERIWENGVLLCIDVSSWGYRALPEFMPLVFPFQGVQPWTLQDFTAVQYFPSSNHCLCMKGLIFNQRQVLVAGVFTLWPSILFLGGDSGFQYLLLWLPLSQPFPEQMPLIQVSLPPLYLSAGYTAPPGFIAVVNHVQGISSLGFGVTVDQPWRPHAITFHPTYTHSSPRLELLYNPDTLWLEFELGKTHTKKEICVVN